MKFTEAVETAFTAIFSLIFLVLFLIIASVSILVDKIACVAERHTQES
jgi:hypothetical protein